MSSRFVCALYAHLLTSLGCDEPESTCGTPYVERCDGTADPGSSSGTVVGTFDGEALRFDVDQATVSDCAAPVTVEISSTIAEGQSTAAYSFVARFRLDEDGSFDTTYHDFEMFWYGSEDAHTLYKSMYSLGGDITQTSLDVEVEDLSTWTIRGSFDGWLAGTLDEEGTSIDIAGSFDVATQSETHWCG